MMKRQPKVLVVGAGPVGLVLAYQLKSRGISVRIIDKEKLISQTSKALSINAASLYVFQSMKIVNKFLHAGKKIQDITIYWNNSRLAYVNLARLKSLYPYYLSLPQSETEAILTNELSGLGLNIERNVSFNSLKQDKEGVEVKTVNSVSGIPELQRYDYVIGCDGSRSMVRAHLGCGFVGYDYPAYLSLIDVYLEEVEQYQTETRYYIKEDGFIILIPLPRGAHRIVIKDKNSDKNRKITLEKYQKTIDYYSPYPLNIKNILWESHSRIYNRLSEKFRDNRVFLAGDAAHLFSPIGGLGMNTGIQDAHNLADKLSGVIIGKFHPDFLNNYEVERLSIAKKLLQRTDDLTRLIMRIDCDPKGNLKNWLPHMKNRIYMKQHWPVSFSGLSNFD
ncbi:MAG: FAD-dependent oxidoreductase [Silvanigrellaceae bacterium]|nr:FAD-dependent oxidoreductase [Silvanigrellaceae bacterium]